MACTNGFLKVLDYNMHFLLKYFRVANIVDLYSELWLKPNNLNANLRTFFNVPRLQSLKL